MFSCGERFLCDEMLARLGRWLRAAGYDTAIAIPGAEDKALLQQAIREKRLLITRDVKLQEHRDGCGVILLLGSNHLAGQLEELSRICSIDWQRKPFSRCLECNEELKTAPDEVRRRVPPQALRQDEVLLYCSHCDKPYWLGSHVRRMQRKLEQLSVGIWDGVVDDSHGEGQE